MSAADAMTQSQHEGIAFTVMGVAAPQGSKRAYVRGGRPILVESSDRVKPWREDVRQSALDAMNGRVPFAGPVELKVSFYFIRPKSVTPAKRPLPTVKPDADKLVRAIGDALTSAGVYVDDAQIVDLHVTKRYGDFALAQITVREVTA